MAFDALAELRAGGNPVDQLSEAQLEVMRSDSGRGRDDQLDQGTRGRGQR